MKTVYDLILEKAKPFFDTRDNQLHIPISLHFARRLLACYPNADPDIVLPAILLHDVGWKVIPEEEHSNAFGPVTNNRETQRLHEVEAVKIAGAILASLDYDPEASRAILAIIDGHDTRKEALSLNDSLVKDADKLWRFTPVGIDIVHSRFKMGREEYMDMLEDHREEWFITDAARGMARKSLAEARGRLPGLDKEGEADRSGGE